MINCYESKLRYTCGIIITIQNGSFSEPKKYQGYTHIAEHMMFSGTQKIPRSELREKHLKIFNELEATTSREEVNIFGYFDLKDFDAAVEVLKQMLFNWQCEVTNFSEEKKYLVKEAKEYFNSCDCKMRKAAYKLLPLKNNEPLGSFAELKKITFDDLKIIKKYWDGLLKKSSLDLTIISGGLKAEQIKSLNKTFCKNIIKSKKLKWRLSSVKLTISKKTAALWFESSMFNLNSFLLNRIFYWRWNNSPDYKFDYDWLQLKNLTAFYVYNETGLKAKQINDFFLKTINKKEFKAAKDLFLKFFRQTLDTVDIIESLEWFSGFRVDKYANLPSNNPKEVYEYFEKLSYHSFSSFINNLRRKANL